MTNLFLLYLKGIFMGVADLLPGISGGTIAFITGIYEELISSLSNIKWKKLFSQSFWQSINFTFFIPLFLGIATAILLLSRVITYLLASFQAAVFAFFFGLILASAYVLFGKIKEHSFSSPLLLILGVLLAFSLSLFTTSLPSSLPIIFFSGLIAISALLLPGISGALLLVILNQYDVVLTALHDVDLKIIATFAAGAITSIVLFSKLIHYLLKKYHDKMLYFLTGLMIGSLRTPAIKTFTGSLAITIPLVLLGAALVIFLEKKFT